MPNPKHPSSFFSVLSVTKPSEKAAKRKRFDELIPIYPNERLKLETKPTEYAMRIIDLIFIYFFSSLVLLC